MNGSPVGWRSASEDLSRLHRKDADINSENFLVIVLLLFNQINNCK